MRARRRRNRLIVPAVLILLLVLLPTLVRLYADFLWFEEVGFTRVLLTELAMRAALFAAVALLAFGFLQANNRIAQRRQAFRPILLQGLQGPPRDVTELVWRASNPIILIVAVLLGLAATSGWLAVWRALHATPFGIADPVFSRDIGFYVFTLPVVAATSACSSASPLLSLLLVPALLAARRHRAGLPAALASSRPPGCTWPSCSAALLFLLTAVRLWLVELPELLYSTTGPLVGASYTDLHARLPALRLTSRALAVPARVAGRWSALRGRRLVRYGALGGRRLRWRWRSSAAASSRWRCRSSWWRRPS